MARSILNRISLSSLGTGTADSTTYLRGDGTWATPTGSIIDASMHGLLVWNYDPAAIASGTVLATNGTVYVCKLRTPISLSVTNLCIYVSTAGASLTAGQNFAALYDGSKNLLGTTANQSSVWNSVGFKSMAISGGPKTVSAGVFYVAFWANGTTRPALARNGNIAAINLNLSAANSRWASANTAVTTTAPTTLGTFTALTPAYWAAVS